MQKAEFGEWMKHRQWTHLFGGLFKGQSRYWLEQIDSDHHNFVFYAVTESECKKIFEDAKKKASNSPKSLYAILVDRIIAKKQSNATQRLLRQNL